MEPDSSVDHPCQGRRSESQSLRLREFFRWLGRREHHPDTSGTSTLDDDIAFREVSLQIPGLNLRSDDQLHHHDEDRGQAEAHASENLARPLVVTPSHSSTEQSRGHLRLLSEILACNLKDSLRLLLEARLRAYANVLAGHGFSLAATNGLDQNELDAGLVDVELKLKALSRLGASVDVSQLSTRFALLDNDEVQLDVVMQLVVPSLRDAKDEVLALKAHAKGQVTATFQAETDKLTSASLTLDTHQLLHGLVDAASRVSSCCIAHLKAAGAQEVETAAQDSAASNVREESVAAGGVPRASLPMHGQLPVVSPEFGPRSHAGLNKATNFTLAMPSLVLKKDDDVAVDELSAEKCELIVDQAIGSVNDDIFLPPSKKRKTT